MRKNSLCLVTFDSVIKDWSSFLQKITQSCFKPWKIKYLCFLFECNCCTNLLKILTVIKQNHMTTKLHLKQDYLYEAEKQLTSSTLISIDFLQTPLHLFGAHRETNSIY